VVLLVVLGIATPLLLGRHPSQPAAYHPGASPSGAASVAPTSTPELPSAQTADHILIPSIGVNAHIENVGRTKQGNMDVPKDPKNVAWYAPGVIPGSPGDAVIAGHLDWYTGPAVFWHLKQVNIGDTINVVFPGGKQVNFRVSKKTSMPYTQEPPYLFGKAGPPMLSLITCAGAWDGTQYQQRLVVDAQLIS
jgi:sortase A